MTFTRLQTCRERLRCFKILLALSAALGIGASAVCAMSAQTARGDGKDAATYIIKRIYKKGDTDRYECSTSGTYVTPQNQSAQVVWKMRVKETTRETKSNGNSLVVTEFDRTSVTVNGEAHEATKMMPKLLTARNKAGDSTVKTEGGDPHVLQLIKGKERSLTFTDMIMLLPPKPVKVGETWEADSPASLPKEERYRAKVTR